MNLIKFIKSFFEKKTAQDTKTGFVKFFNRSRGYGFIQSNEFNNRIFVHISELKDHIRTGDRVKFEVEADSKGPRAKNVELMAEAS